MPNKMPRVPRPAALEPLEGRRLMAGHLPFGRGSFGGAFSGRGFAAGGFLGSLFGHHGTAAATSVTFSQAPAAVQTGLTSLAGTDGVAAPTATTTLRLGNVAGVETYTYTATGTGTVSRLTVNAAGGPVTAPTRSTTTFSALPAAAAVEVTAIAAALGATAPAASDTVAVSTTAAGVATYTDRLADASVRSGTASVSVDAAGNPVGRQSLPASVIPAAILAGLNAAAPAGVTALVASSTQTVRVGTSDGVVTYTTTFTTAGTVTTVTVDEAGTAVSKPTTTSGTFSAVPAAVQAALQSLATAAGYSGTIPATQAVSVYTETTGAALYTATLTVTTTTASGTATRTFTVDASGNPSVLPGGRGRHHGGFLSRWL